MKRVLLVVGAGLLAGLLTLAWGWQQWTGPGPRSLTGEQSVTVRIPRGMTLSAAADTLVERGLLRHRRSLLLGARLTGQDRGLRAGLYELAAGLSPRDLLLDLTSGLSVQTVLTLPEGWDSAEIAAEVGRVLGLAPEWFLAVADSLARRAVEQEALLPTPRAVGVHDSLLTAATSQASGRTFHWCEGLLAPDTYHFAEGSSPETVAGVLLETQLDRLRDVRAAMAGSPTADLAPLELVSLASLVEAEARRDDERTRIAAVYSNRLRRNWRLEADPTVAFVLNKKGKRLFFKDLKVDSPFNTYRRKGLPAGPIGTPGLASLAAAAWPDSNCDAMYFVSDGADRHVFSRTAREHEAAVQRFRAARSAERRGR